MARNYISLEFAKLAPFKSALIKGGSSSASGHHPFLTSERLVTLGKPLTKLDLTFRKFAPSDVRVVARNRHLIWI